jgi:hypothetical protein
MGVMEPGHNDLSATEIAQLLKAFHERLTDLFIRQEAIRHLLEERGVPLGAVDAKAAELRALWDQQLQEHVKTHAEQAETARMLRFLESFDEKSRTL